MSLTTPSRRHWFGEFIDGILLFRGDVDPKKKEKKKSSVCPVVGFLKTFDIVTHRDGRVRRELLLENLLSITR